jgi:O-antigen/teichoic acid export membrane protein
MGFASPLITRWMGPGFEGSVMPLQVLAVTGIVLVGQGPLGNILLGTGRHRLVAFVSLGEAVANLVLSVFLVRRLGLLGVAVGTGVPVFIANLFILAPAACRQLNVRVLDFARAVAVGPLVGALIAAVAGALVRDALPPQSLPAIIGEGAAVGVIYFAAVWIFGFDHAIRERYSAFGRQLIAVVTHGPSPVASATQAPSPQP